MTINEYRRALAEYRADAIAIRDELRRRKRKRRRDSYVSQTQTFARLQAVSAEGVKPPRSEGKA